MKQKNFYFYSNLLAWGLVLLLIGNFVFGWTTPSSTPPAGNVEISFSPWTASSTDIYYNDGNVGIGTTTLSSKLHVQDGSVLFSGTTGSTPVSGAGTRLMWIPAKAAFRAGKADATCWNNENIGNYSFAIGELTTASEQDSVATGYGTTASGWASTAMGYGTTASGDLSVATGYETTASGNYSTAAGDRTIASGFYSVATGYGTTASGWPSTAMGDSTIASGDYSLSIGEGIEAAGNYTVAIALNDQTGTVVSQNNTMAIMGGNVGIGTTTPGSALDVAGTVTATALSLPCYYEKTSRSPVLIGNLTDSYYVTCDAGYSMISINYFINQFDSCYAHASYLRFFSSPREGVVVIHCPLNDVNPLQSVDVLGLCCKLTW